MTHVRPAAYGASADGDPAPATLGPSARGAAAALFCLATSVVIIKTGRDAQYFGGGGLARLPAAYMLTAALALPTAAVTLAAIRRAGIRTTRIWAPVVAAIAIGVPAQWPGALPAWAATATFIQVPLAFGVMFSLVWTLVSDAAPVSGHARARHYSSAGLTALAGGVVGGLVARSLAAWAPSALIVATGAILLATSAVLLARAEPRQSVARRVVSQEPGSAAGARGLLTVPVLVSLAGISMIAAATGVLIEFQFFFLASAVDPASPTGYAHLYLVLNVAAMTVQWLILPRLQALTGPLLLLAAVPVSVLALAPGMALAPTFGTASTLRMVEGGLKGSLHRVAWEQVTARIPAHRRAATKLAIEGPAARIAEGLAGLVLMAWVAWVGRTQALSQASIVWMALVVAGLSMVWIVLIGRLRRDPSGSACPSDEEAPRPVECCPIVATLAPSAAERGPVPRTAAAGVPV